MGKFIAALWNGKTFSLAKHYWLFLVVPGIVFSVLGTALELTSLSFTPTSYRWAIGALWIIAMIVFIVGYVGLINCARTRAFRGWSSVAVGVTSLSLLLGIARAVNEFTGNPVEATGQLYEAAASINAQVPKKLDSVTTLTGAEYRDDVFTYYYEIDPAAYHSPNWSSERAAAIVKRNACSMFKDSVGSQDLRMIRYRYKVGTIEAFVIEVGKKDCEAAH
jgi:hypothetical protein